MYFGEVREVPEQQEVPQQSRGNKQHKQKGMNDMELIDPNGLANYNAGIEVGRLHRNLGLIEFARTKEMLLEELPPPKARISSVMAGM